MAKILQCPNLICINLSIYCLGGRFPANCESCDCKDKQYVEQTTSNVTNI